MRVSDSNLVKTLFTESDRVLYCSVGRTPRVLCSMRLKCDGTRAETRFRLSAKQMSPFKSAGASVQSTTGSRGGISGSNGSNAGYTMLRGSVKSTGYSIHSPVSPSLPLPCVTVCHYISTELYQWFMNKASVEDDLGLATYENAKH